MGLDQGLALSPAEFVLGLDLAAAAVQDEATTAESESTSQFTMEGSLHGGQAAGSVTVHLSIEGGETIASTSSYLSELDVVNLMAYGTPRVEGFELEIPRRELDDPPDWFDQEAASQGESENELYL